MPRLDDIRARLAAATPGPWVWDRSDENNQWGDCGPHLVSEETERHSWTPPSTGEKREYDVPVHQIITASGYDASSLSVEDADAALIANAPTDLAALTKALDAVLFIHTAVGYSDRVACSGCGMNAMEEPIAYPCPTVTAITEALEGPQ